jgi:hypothetical protein
VSCLIRYALFCASIWRTSYLVRYDMRCSVLVCEGPRSFSDITCFVMFWCLKNIVAFPILHALFSVGIWRTTYLFRYDMHYSVLLSEGHRSLSEMTCIVLCWSLIGIVSCPILHPLFCERVLFPSLLVRYDIYCSVLVFEGHRNLSDMICTVLC